MLTTVLSLLVVLGVLVFIHELGHFAAAKWAGIYVYRFSLGLGSPVAALTVQRGETEYCISWLPLGGYVKMASAEEDPAAGLEGDRPNVEVPANRMFEAKPVWKRVIVIMAGVTMNALFAWAVFVGLAYDNGRPIDPVTTVGRVIDSLVPAGAEALKSLHAGDRITAVNGQPVTAWGDIEQGIALGAGSEITLEVAGRDQPLRLAIPQDALEERIRASGALEPFRAPVIGQVVTGKPGARAGLAVGDTVSAVDGKPVEQWTELVGLIQQSAGRPLVLSLKRSAGPVEVTVTPEAEKQKLPDGTTREVGKIGIGVKTDFRSEPYSVAGAIKAGTSATLAASTQIVRSIQGMLSGRVSARQLGGPILIGQMAGESARAGLDTFLGFMALISINLAVLNLLPIPVLDGGQLLFLLAEGLIRRPLSRDIRERLTLAGLALVVVLMVVAFSNDIMRLVGR